MITNKAFIYKTSRDVDIETILGKKGLEYDYYTANLENALLSKNPILSRFPSIDVWFFKDIDLLLNLKSKLSKEYPNSSYFIEFNKEDSLYNNKTVFYSFIKEKKHIVDSYLLRYPAEKFGIENKISLKSLNTPSINFFNNSSDFLKLFSLITI
jgi:hypothetical protein